MHQGQDVSGSGLAFCQQVPSELPNPTRPNGHQGQVLPFATEQTAPDVS